MIPSLTHVTLYIFYNVLKFYGAVRVDTYIMISSLISSNLQLLFVSCCFYNCSLVLNFFVVIFITVLALCATNCLTC